MYQRYFSRFLNLLIYKLPLSSHFFANGIPACPNLGSIICDRGQGGRIPSFIWFQSQLGKGHSCNFCSTDCPTTPGNTCNMEFSSFLFALLVFPATPAVNLGAYEAAMKKEVNMAHELLNEFYEDVYDLNEDVDDLKPESKDFLPDDYFDIGQPANNVNQESPTFTEQVKKALLKSAKMKKKSAGLQTTDVIPVSKQTDQKETVVSIRPPSSRDPTFVLSRLLYHMARLPTPP